MHTFRVCTSILYIVLYNTVYSVTHTMHSTTYSVILAYSILSYTLKTPIHTLGQKISQSLSEIWTYLYIVKNTIGYTLYTPPYIHLIIYLLYTKNKREWTKFKPSSYLLIQDPFGHTRLTPHGASLSSHTEPLRGNLLPFS